MTLMVETQAKPSPEIYSLAASLFDQPPPSSACLVFEVITDFQFSSQHQHQHYTLSKRMHQME